AVEPRPGLAGLDLLDRIALAEEGVAAERDPAPAPGVPGQAEDQPRGGYRDDAAPSHRHVPTLARRGRSTEAVLRLGVHRATYARFAVPATRASSLPCHPSPRMPWSCAPTSWARRARWWSCSPESAASCGRWPRGPAARGR